MHTSRPRKLMDRKTGVIYKYLLHWGSPQLPIEQHYILNEGNILSVGLAYLLEDFNNALELYLADVSNSHVLQSNADSVWKKVILQKF